MLILNKDISLSLDLEQDRINCITIANTCAYRRSYLSQFELYQTWELVKYNINNKVGAVNKKSHISDISGNIYNS